MTCRKCKYEFCWTCLGEWKPHGTNWYNCTKEVNKKYISDLYTPEL